MVTEKYLFFYLKTGGGHLAPARAVAERIKSKQKGKTEIILSDGLKDAKPYVRKIIEDGYKTSVNKALWTYEFLYALHKLTSVSRLTSAIVAFFLKPGIERQILSEKPQKIVVFHFFIVKPVYEIIEKHKLNIPVLTVVTDPFTAHPIWFLRKDQKFILFSELLKEKCMKIGIEKENMKVFPFILDKKFSRKLSYSKVQEMRKKLGFRPDSRIILIMGGGDGMPKGKKILKNIITSNLNAEIAVVCGSNTEMLEHIEITAKKHSAKNLKVYGYVDFVHSLISISDLVITKCGASTFMEILLMGKIPVINNYIWEQEKGNMEFVCESNMGILEKDTRRIPDVLNKLLNDNEMYNTISENIKKASFRNGVGPVSDYILELNS